MANKVIDQGKTILRPRARIIRTIGKDLISNEIVALVELIKNAYDADSDYAKITFIEPLKRDDGEIIIEDGGIGMSLQTVKEAWFEPATIKKKRERLTIKGRRVTGEKGIGRFVAARIAQHMEMSSIAMDSDQLVKVLFNWGEFDDEERFLDQVKCSWSVIQITDKRSSGTTLRLKRLNDDWSTFSFVKLRSELSRLVSPFELEQRKDKFMIELELPSKYREYAGEISTPEVIEKPHYRIKGTINNKGVFTAVYDGLDTEKPLKLKEEIKFSDNRIPFSGAFKFEFRVWDRDTKSLEPLTKELDKGIPDLRRDLDSAYGISIYRDGFRILLADRDWLGLDHRRVQNPTMRLSNNQIVGYVWISADDNKELSDQSDREGIVSSPAFIDFKEVIKEILTKIETQRYDYRRLDKSVEPILSLFESLDFAPIKSYIEKKYPDDRELSTFLEEKSRTFSHGVAEAKKVISRYRRLATLGQLIDIVLHEGRTQTGAIKNASDLGIRETALDESRAINRKLIEKQFLDISKHASILAKQFDRLAPLSGRKRGRPKQIFIEDVITNACETESRNIGKLDIEIDISKTRTPIMADFGDLIQIFLNLLQNSLYWLGKIPKEGRTIIIEVSQMNDQIEIIFSDSGIGVDEAIEDKIFDPYFSSKPDGVGLGLTIAGEAALEYNGALELIEGGPLPGATFRIILRKR